MKVLMETGRPGLPESKFYHNFFKPREAFNAYSHLMGAVLSIPALVLLLRQVPVGSRTGTYVSLGVFGVSMFMLYLTSGIYHLVNASARALRILRKLDHIMIYILIAGTYTPLCMLFLTGAWRWGLFISIWSLALIGLVFKLVWFSAPRWLSTLTYVLMGWLVVIALWPLSRSMPAPGWGWLAAGGVAYSLGALIYATKRPRIHKLSIIGFHEIFHIFVLAGSFSHFWLFFSCL